MQLRAQRADAISVSVKARYGRTDTGPVIPVREHISAMMCCDGGLRRSLPLGGAYSGRMNLPPQIRTNRRQMATVEPSR